MGPEARRRIPLSIVCPRSWKLVGVIVRKKQFTLVLLLALVGSSLALVFWWPSRTSTVPDHVRDAPDASEARREEPHPSSPPSTRTPAGASVVGAKIEEAAHQPRLHASFRGVVVSPEQVGVEGALVALIDRGERIAESVTRVGGSFEFGHESAPRECVLLVQATGYASTVTGIKRNRGERVVLDRGVIVRGRIHGLAEGAEDVVIRGRVVTPFKGPVVPYATTDATGQFAFSELPGRELLLLVLRDGKQAFPYPCVVDDAGASVDIFLPREVEVILEVTDKSTGEAISGVKVLVDDSLVAQTSVDGAAAVPLLEGEKGRLILEKEGYCGAWAIVKAAATNLSPVEVALVPEAVVWGRVRDAEGRPLASVAVRLVVREGEGEVYDVSVIGAATGTLARTDDAGVFEVSGIGGMSGSSRVRLELSSPGKCHRLTDVIDVANGARVGPLELELRDGGAIAGRVLSNGEAAPAQVSVVAAGRVAWTDDNGAFYLDGLALGEHEVFVQLEAEPSISKTLRVAARVHPDDVTIALDHVTASCWGTVSSDTGPLEGVQVDCRILTDGDVVSEYSSQADGSGRYVIELPWQGLTSTTLEVGVERWSEGVAPQVLSAPGEASFRVASSSRASLECVDALSGEAVPGVGVSWIPSGDPAGAKTLFTDSTVEGELSFHVPEGSGYLLVERGGYAPCRVERPESRATVRVLLERLQ